MVYFGKLHMHLCIMISLRDLDDTQKNMCPILRWNMITVTYQLLFDIMNCLNVIILNCDQL